MSAPPIIRIEQVSKRFAIQRARTYMSGGLLTRVLGPLRRLTSGSPPLVAEEMWALRDVSFDVQAGEVLALVGRNGAGKSTLLKLLSRITEPTAGRLRVRGRLTSLLEVGTGFHPELSGRENVFLNGAILGMRTADIRRRFDAIVAFSGVERFIDVPVKRYSSGMYVRLAFAIAAHLEHEIMIVDEVLSVGDAAFREQCLAVIERGVREEGRTVLFVSHDLGQVRRVAGRAVLLEAGRVAAVGTAEAIVGRYLERLAEAAPRSSLGGALLAELALETSPGAPFEAVVSGGPCTFRVALGAVAADATLELELETLWGARLATLATRVGPSRELRLALDQLPLAAGTYKVGAVLRLDGRELERLPGGLQLLVLPPAPDAPIVSGDGPLALSARWRG